MVSVDYMIAKPPPPSALRRLFNQRAMPAAIDAATRVEDAVHTLGESTRQQPILALSLAVGAGVLLGAAWPRQSHAAAASATLKGRGK
jgi:hypothetical protein